MHVPCEHVGVAYHLLERHAAQRQSEAYQADGSLVLCAAVLDSAVAPLTEQLRNATAGRVCASRA